MDKLFDNGIRLYTKPTEEAVYLDMALAMLAEIRKNNAAGKDTVMIVPVGPTGQYEVFARLVNELRVPLTRVHLFNMDEYLLDPATPVPYEHPMSFHASMDRNLYSRIDGDLNVPAGQRHFPEPGREAAFDARMEALGGVDLCLGGLGINGHLAFNEPPEPGEAVSAGQFAALPTRVLRISRETRTVNAIGYQRGDIRGMPPYCITVGMRQILSARRVYVALSRDWQHGIARHVLYGEVTSAVPASLLQRHGDVRIVAPEHIAKGLA